MPVHLYIKIRKRILNVTSARLPYTVEEEKTGCELSKLEKTGMSVFIMLHIMKITEDAAIPLISRAKKNFVLLMLISDKAANT